MGKRPTLADLARAAGVSVATVDRVLNARHRVREPTAERVLGAAEAIGFHGAPLMKRRVRLDAPDAHLRLSAAAARTRSTASSAPISQAATARLADVSRQGDRRLRQRPFARRHRRAPAAAGRGGAGGRRRLGRSSPRQRRDRRPARARRADLRHAHRTRRRGRAPAMSAATIARKGAPRPGSSPRRRGGPARSASSSAVTGFSARRRPRSRSAPICAKTRPSSTPLEPLVNLEDPRIAYAATQDMIATPPRSRRPLYLRRRQGRRDRRRARRSRARGPLAIVCNELTPMSARRR